MRNLIKKILRESDNLDWIINTQPTFGQVFQAATENDPRIVVYLSDDGEIEKIDDEAGYHYYSDSYDRKLDSPEVLLKLAKDNITGYKDKNDNDWCHFRDVVIKTFFPDMNNNLNESEEEDPFKWIKDIQPISYEYLLGKGLHFQPLITNGGDLDRILNFLENIGFEVGDNLRYFDFEGEGMDLEGLYLNPRTNKVTWTSDLSYNGEDYEEHIRDYAERPVEVLDGWETLEGYI